MIEQKYLGHILCVFFIFLGCAANAQSTAGEPLEEVLVIGEQPGPALWKVSKGEHVLWIMATLKPLPKKMTWRSRQVEDVLAHSQEYITPAAIHAHLSQWGKLSLLPSLIGIRNNPDGKKLKTVVPAELYARWLVLKKKYIGRDSGIEKWRPIFAANELYEKALDKTGLTMQSNIMDTLSAIAKKNQVKKAGPGADIEIEKPNDILKKFKKMPLDDVECFAKTIERLETDLNTMRARANAWATGDMEAFRELTYVDHDEICKDIAFNAEIMAEQGFQDIPKRKQHYWMDEAERSLNINASTFAILPIGELLKVDGYVDELRTKGYTVAEP
jgi:hypothetical protein